MEEEKKKKKTRFLQLHSDVPLRQRKSAPREEGDESAPRDNPGRVRTSGWRVLGGRTAFSGKPVKPTERPQSDEHGGINGTSSSSPNNKVRRVITGLPAADAKKKKFIE
ncbi:hypothetical protein CEXT_193691 [Caerostris extrusa]|uniref:Uncharacterized protein n=1 Tax=Caerostris extrusa TaxID=172846 RepID=A0AAV4WVW1_CAEEX|nr:hypothetical protein CEXT_193691 [Caerostris extrusa]